ncbi:MAG: class I SAM-dependent methyltransferase [Dongiaceae bacterium]
MTDPVRDQYEALPYPAREPRDEAKRLIEGSPSHLLEVNHYVFAGRRDFTRPFRALVAGGGTGDATVMLAQHLADRGCPAEIVHLDLSDAAIRVAAARAGARGLGFVRFVASSLEDLPGLGLGRFDYIDCCGVLHHLADPAAGLGILAAALAEGGGMGLMVYGALGRTGVYHVQAMLRLLAPAESVAVRLDLARRLLRQLPPTNWFARNPALGDHLLAGDAGLYDLLLHARDRAFTVPEIVDLAAGAGLEIAAFVEPWRYRPESYLNDPALLERLAGLDRIEAAGFAEQLAGNLKSHIFYVVAAGRAASAVARPDDPSAVPVLRARLGEASGGARDGAALPRVSKPGGGLTVRINGLEARFALPPRAGPILARIDGRRSLREIHDDLAAAGRGRLDWPTFKADFDRVYALLNGLNRLFVAYPAG